MNAYKPTFRVISQEELDLVFTENIDTNTYYEIIMALDIWGLKLIESNEVAELFHPAYFIDKKGIEEHNIFEYYKNQELFYDEELPIKVYIRYPITEIVELVIDPIFSTHPLRNEREQKVMSLGFIAWQIALFFQDVSDGKYPKIEFTGHSIEDLQLSSFLIIEDNIFMAKISS